MDISTYVSIGSLLFMFSTIALLVVVRHLIQRLEKCNFEYPLPSEEQYRASLARHNYLMALHPKGDVVYVIRDITTSGLYKIGYTTDIETRLKGITSGGPFQIHLVHLIPHHDVAWLEKTLHDLFADKRVTGEWFRLGEIEISYLQTSPVLNGGMLSDTTNGHH